MRSLCVCFKKCCKLTLSNKVISSVSSIEFRSPLFSLRGLDTSFVGLGAFQPPTKCVGETEETFLVAFSTVDDDDVTPLIGDVDTRDVSTVDDDDVTLFIGDVDTREVSTEDDVGVGEVVVDGQRADRRATGAAVTREKRGRRGRR